MPLLKSMYTLPSTSVSVTPWPFSNTTGQSVTWLEYPVMCFIPRSLYARDLGPGTSGVTTLGTDAGFT